MDCSVFSVLIWDAVGQESDEDKQESFDGYVLGESQGWIKYSYRNKLLYYLQIVC